MTRVDDRERAARWLRVSTLGQDEKNQEPDVDAWITAHGYELGQCGPNGDGTYRLKVSASKGQQQKMLDLVVEDMREGRLTVLVVWTSSRIERRGAWSAFDLVRKVRDAGGRIEYVQDAYLNEANSLSDVMLALAATKDKEFSEDRKKNALRNARRIKANNGVLTCLPWGYLPAGEKYAKAAVPTDACREYWPRVLGRCMTGDSCRTIAAWLDSEDVKPIKGGQWDEDVIRRLIRNPVYCGRRLGWKDAPLLAHEAVVSVDAWKRANDALSHRPKRGPRSPFVNPVKPLLAKLRCARAQCGSPMYRIHAGSRDGGKYYYYRCAGSGPQRKGCGNVVPLEQTETIVAVRVFLTSNEPHRIKTWVEGVNWDAEIADIRLQMRELDPESEEDEMRRDELKAQLREFRRKNEEEATSGDWKWTDTGMTVGEYFHGLDAEGKREYLKNRDIRVEKVLNPPLEPGASVGLHVVIDGEDHGVFPYPPLRSSERISIPPPS